MEVQVLGQLASTGVVGAFLVIALLALRAKDKALQESTEARIKESQDGLRLVMTIQASVIEAVHKLGQIVDAWEKRQDVERRHRSDKP